jgi:hypothetical protein
MYSFRGDPESFDLIAPFIQNIGTLYVEGLMGVEELRQVFPDFPRSTPKLQSLTLSNGGGYTWDRSIDPFESLADSLRYLRLINIPLYPSFLRLRTLTELVLTNRQFDLHLDTLLDFLEENRSLECVSLWIAFTERSLRGSRRRAAIGNRLRYLSIVACGDAFMDTRALISSFALQRGAHLEISSEGSGTRFTDVVSGISTAHLLNLPSPTFMEYGLYGNIRLAGPNGTLSLEEFCVADPFVAFPPLFLANIRELRLMPSLRNTNPPIFHPPPFPALETLAIRCKSSPSHLLSTLFSNPSSSPSLKTLAFLNCDLSDGFMEELVGFALNRKGTTAAWLHHVVIVDSGGRFPGTHWMDVLAEHVPIVDVRRDKKFPADMTQCLENIPHSRFSV